MHRKPETKKLRLTTRHKKMIVNQQKMSKQATRAKERRMVTDLHELWATKNHS